MQVTNRGGRTLSQRQISLNLAYINRYIRINMKIL